MERTVHIETFCLGPWMTNCFVVHRGGTACWIVDVGFAPEPMIDYIRSNGMQPSCVLMTHAHVDHIAGLAAARAVWPDVPILIHAAERDFLTDPSLNMSLMLADPVVAPKATGTLKHGQKLELEGCEFELRHTPGHSPGGLTLYDRSAEVAIVGDTLFADSIGRTDFPSSDHATLIRSIREQLLTLPDQTRALPGHGPATTIGQERIHNRFLQDASSY